MAATASFKKHDSEALEKIWLVARALDRVVTINQSVNQWSTDYRMRHVGGTLQMLLLVLLLLLLYSPSMVDKQWD